MTNTMRKKPDTLGKAGAIFGIVYSILAMSAVSMLWLIFGIFFLDYFTTSSDVYLGEIITSIIVMGTLTLFNLIYIVGIIIFALYIPGIVDNKIFVGVVGIITGLIPGVLIFISKQEIPEGYEETNSAQAQEARAAAKAKAKADAKAHKEANPVQGASLIVKMGSIIAIAIAVPMILLMMLPALFFGYGTIYTIISHEGIVTLWWATLAMNSLIFAATSIYVVIGNISLLTGRGKNKKWTGILSLILLILPGLLILFGEYNQKEEYAKEVEQTEQQGPEKIGLIGSILGMVFMLFSILMVFIALLFAVFAVYGFFFETGFGDVYNPNPTGKLTLGLLIRVIMAKLIAIGTMFASLTTPIIVGLGYYAFIEYLLGRSETKIPAVIFGLIAGIVPGVLILLSDYGKKQKE